MQVTFSYVKLRVSDRLSRRAAGMGRVAAAGSSRQPSACPPRLRTGPCRVEPLRWCMKSARQHTSYGRSHEAISPVRRRTRSGRCRPIDRVCTGECRVRLEHGLASLTEEPDVEELKGASVAQDRPAASERR